MILWICCQHWVTLRRAVPTPQVCEFIRDYTTCCLIMDFNSNIFLSILISWRLYFPLLVLPTNIYQQMCLKHDANNQHLLDIDTGIHHGYSIHFVFKQCVRLSHCLRRPDVLRKSLWCSSITSGPSIASGGPTFWKHTSSSSMASGPSTASGGPTFCKTNTFV